MALRCKLQPESVDTVLASTDVLAAIDFSGAARGTDPRHVVTGVPVINGPLCEVWYSSGPVNVGRDGNVSWATEGDAAQPARVFVHAMATLAADAPPATAEATARRVWRDLLRAATAHGCQQLVRAWNHIPAVNWGTGDNERYKRFCVGRHDALIAHGYVSAEFSAASGVGNFGNTLVVYLIASREPVTHFENPQQVSAYAYPRQYGERPPSFARATVQVTGADATIYVSGTASVVGHATVHPDDPRGQLPVALENVDRVLQQAAPNAVTAPVALRVYVRELRNAAWVTCAVRERFGHDIDIACLRADICSADLALEIEGVWRADARHGLTPPSAKHGRRVAASG